MGTCPRGKRGPREVVNSQGTAWQLFRHHQHTRLYAPSEFLLYKCVCNHNLNIEVQVLCSTGPSNTCLATDNTAITNITCISRTTNITSLIVWEQTDKNQVHMLCLFTQGIAGSPWFTVNKFRERKEPSV